MATGVKKSGRRFLSPEVIQYAASLSNSVLLESSKLTKEDFRSYLFSEPVEIIRADALEFVEPCLNLADKALAEGYYVAGFVSYEAGYAFESSLPPPRKTRLPLVWLGVFKKPILFDHRRNRFGSRNCPLVSAKEVESGLRSPIRYTMNETEYVNDVGRILQYIVEGDTYQANYTFKLRYELSNGIAGLYCRLRNAQRVGYGALIRMEESSVLSFSPELFFRVDGSRITLRPMKGTAPRGRNLAEDDENEESLKLSDKNRSENLMIVDLLRNDVGKIAKVGSVKVKKFFEVEKYDTLLQATSTIQASLRRGTKLSEMFRALFPSGSVTGAPKLRTMQIIHELERESRGVYTGAIGFAAPDGKAVFNVAIRTLVMNHAETSAEMGIGSGIVHDSIPVDEYKECLLKAKFLEAPVEEFKLLETVRWNSEMGWFLLREHLERLRTSALYFDYNFDRTIVMTKLKGIETILRKKTRIGKSHMVRLLLDREGGVEISDSELKPVEGHQYTRIATQRTESSDRFLFHKTTNRKSYDDAISLAGRMGLYDFIFLNERGEVTEGGRSNIVIKSGHAYVTPPITSGLLPGVYRAHLFTQKNFRIVEQVLYEEDLWRADEIYLCNSVRGMVRVILKDVHQHKEEDSHAELLALEN